MSSCTTCRGRRGASGRTRRTDNLAYYQQAIARHYFSVVILSFNQTPLTDYAIALDMATARGYQLAAKVRSGKTVFYVWEDIGRV